MRIRALPISEWSAGEVCGHVCSRGSRGRRVSGICVVSTLAVCVRSSLNAGPVDVSGRRWSATNGSNGSSRVGFRPRARVGHPLSSTEGYLSRHSHRVLQPPANQCRQLATIDTRRTARTSQPRGDRWAGEASGTDIQLGPDGRREGAISRGSNFGLWRREEGKERTLFFFITCLIASISFFWSLVWSLVSLYSKGAAPNSKPNSNNRYKAKLASENLARIWRLN